MRSRVSYFYSYVNCHYFILRFKLLSAKEAKGLGTFVGTFALPAMIFTALCTLNLSCVNWTFVLSILITKTILFVVVLVVSLLVNHGHNIGKAGLYSIFVTQSNDFALGYPILNALYGQTHPEYPSYLYLLAPISLAILNPIGCIFMEIDKVKASTQNEKLEKENQTSYDSTSENTSKECIEGCSSPDTSIDNLDSIENKPENKVRVYNNNDRYRVQRKISEKIATAVNEMGDVVINERKKTHFAKISLPTKSKTVCKIFFGIFSNPIIILTFAGVIFGQFVFHGNLPPLINNFLQTLKSAYSATALFSLGLGMVGKMEALKNGSKLLGPFILIVSKVILMPLIAREITNLLFNGSNEEDSSELANFAFLYGTFPTAPTVYVLATRYGIASGIIATTMIACTFLSAPIMFVSGA